MSIVSAYGPGRLGLSFELFPPKTDDGEQSLYGHVAQLMQFQPDFITCTYGAGGSTRAKTLQIVAQVKQRFSVPVASHLTCVGSTIEQLRQYLHDAQQLEIEGIVALRGDPPRGQESFQAVAGGLRYANELVALIHSEFPRFEIAVAGYPEVHQEAASAESDLEHLKRKVDSGGQVVITQLFYQNDHFFDFRQRYEAAGIKAPLVPGILPITNLAQIQRITALCGARLPAELVRRLGQHEDPQWQHQVGVEFATDQVRQLLASAIAGLHFYVLNKSQATSAVLRAVGLRR